MLCQSKVVSKVLSRGHGMSESPETKKVWTQVERWGEGMFLLDVKRSWKHWAVWRNVVYSVCSEKWGGGIVSRKMGHGDCTGDLSESRWLIKVSFSQGWRRKWWAWWTSGHAGSQTLEEGGQASTWIPWICSLSRLSPQETTDHGFKYYWIFICSPDLSSKLLDLPNWITD